MSTQEVPRLALPSIGKARWQAWRFCLARWRSLPLVSRWAGVLVAAHLALGVLYSVTVPIWEAHDEWAHYKYVEYIARHRALPPAGQRLTTEYRYDQANQPPLYYILAAIPVSWVDTSDGLKPVVNPYADTGDGWGGINFAVHDPEIERFPYRGTVLAVHVARWASVLMSLLALGAVYALGRLTHPRDPGVILGALAIAAFMPQFLFIGSVVTNDVLITGLGSWVTVFGLRLALPGGGRRDALLLGVTLGLALLTKYTALALIPLALIAGAIGLAREVRHGASPRRTWGTVGAFLGALVGIAGWWFWRNYTQYGQWLPRDPWAVYWLQERLREPWGLLRGLEWSAVPGMLRYGFQTFWLSFGWGNLGAPMWVYRLFALISSLGVLGLARAWFRRDRPAHTRLLISLLFLQLLFVIALPLYRELLHRGSVLRGRYLLPALGSVSLLIAWGLRELPWPSRLARFHPLAVVGGGMALLSLTLPFWLIIPAYRPPPLLSELELKPTEQPLHAVFGERAELVAYEIWPTEVKPGQAVAVTLLWRALAPMRENYTVGVHVLGEGYQDYGQRNAYPGRGNFATTLWKPGDLFRETYWVPVQPPPDGVVPTAGRVSVALFLDDEEQTHLPVTDAQGRLIGGSAIFGRFRIGDGQPPPPPPDAPLGVVGEEIALVRAEATPTPVAMAGFSIPVTLTWQALATPAADYTIFVQLLTEDGRWVAGYDAPPRDGNYPTGLWRTGDVVTHTVTLALPTSLPSGVYRLVTGMYRQEDMRRLPARNAAGALTADGAITFRRLYIAGREHRAFIPSVYTPRGDISEP